MKVYAKGIYMFLWRIAELYKIHILEEKKYSFFLEKSFVTNLFSSICPINIEQDHLSDNIST